jgi:hypothetical protein
MTRQVPGAFATFSSSPFLSRSLMGLAGTTHVACKKLSPVWWIQQPVQYSKKSQLVVSLDTPKPSIFLS